MEKWIERLSNDHGLAEEEVRTLVSMGEKRHFRPGDLVLRRGETDSNIYVIVSGIWRSYSFGDGDEATMWFSVAGEMNFSVWGMCQALPRGSA